MLQVDQIDSDWFWWHIGRVISCLEVKESHSFYVHFLLLLFLKSFFFLFWAHFFLMQLILNRSLWPIEEILTLTAIVGQSGPDKIAIKGYSKLPISLEQAHHQMQFSVISMIRLFLCVLHPLPEVQSAYSPPANVYRLVFLRHLGILWCGSTSIIAHIFFLFLNHRKTNL